MLLLCFSSRPESLCYFSLSVYRQHRAVVAAHLAVELCSLLEEGIAYAQVTTSSYR